MKLEPNMYVRTDNGIIGKIYEQIGDMFTYKDNNRDYVTYGLSHNEILKSSHNIIDLIEVGDYVNGYKVKAVYLKGYRKYIKLSNAYESGKGIRTYNEDIKTIVTKEVFESMKYEVNNKVWVG